MLLLFFALFLESRDFIVSVVGQDFIFLGSSVSGYGIEIYLATALLQWYVRTAMNRLFLWCCISLLLSTSESVPRMVMLACLFLVVLAMVVVFLTFVNCCELF